MCAPVSPSDTQACFTNKFSWCPGPRRQASLSSEITSLEWPKKGQMGKGGQRGQRRTERKRERRSPKEELVVDGCSFRRSFIHLGW